MNWSQFRKGQAPRHKGDKVEVLEGKFLSLKLFFSFGERDKSVVKWNSCLRDRFGEEKGRVVQFPRWTRWKFRKDSLNRLMDLMKEGETRKDVLNGCHQF